MLVWRTALAGVVLGAVMWIVTAASPAHTHVTPVGQRESLTDSTLMVRFVSGTRFDAPIASTTLTLSGACTAGVDPQVATSRAIAISETPTLKLGTIARR